MSLATYVESKKQKMAWYDISVLKWTMFFFGLFVAKIYPAILGLDALWYGVLFAVPTIYLLYKMYIK